MGVFVFVGRWEKPKGSLNWFFPQNNTLYTLGNYVFLCIPMSNFLSSTSGHFSNEKLKQLLTLRRIPLKIDINMRNVSKRNNEKKCKNLFDFWFQNFPNEANFCTK